LRAATVLDVEIEVELVVETVVVMHPAPEPARQAAQPALAGVCWTCTGVEYGCMEGR